MVVLEVEVEVEVEEIFEVVVTMEEVFEVAILDLQFCDRCCSSTV